MKLVADLHTHTLASNHAYSSLKEMMDGCRSLGMEAMAVTDHAPAMPDAPHVWYFHNIQKLPNWMPDGFLLLRGSETNAVDTKGTLDLDEWLLRNLDWIIVSLHRSCIAPLDEEEATALWLKVAENPYVDMIGHSEQRQYKYDYDLVTKAFAKNNKVVELNANSAAVRPGNEENLRQLALACKRNGTQIAVNSDAHSIFDLGNQGPILTLLKDIDFPEELVVNASMDTLHSTLKAHGLELPSHP